MAGYSYGKKKTFKEKMTDLKGKAKRGFILAAIGTAAIGGPVYYHYGTIHEEDVKIKEVKKEWVRYDEKKGAIYEYKIITDKGTVLGNENTLLHWKFNSGDIQAMLEEGRSDNSYYSYYESAQEKKDREANVQAVKNKVYHISYYGARIDVPFIHTFPNLLSIREVTPEELRARAEARASADKSRQEAMQQQNGAQPNGAVQPVQNGQPAPAAAATGALSGTMITFETVVDGQKIQMTVPIEAANKITVNKVTPLVPNTPAPRGPGG